MFFKSLRIMRSISGTLLLLLLLPLVSCSHQPGKNNDDFTSLPVGSEQWYEQPLRILQTVLREPDGSDYDVESVISYMEKTNSNVLVVNAGGIIDFFNNPLPAANVNQFLKEGDDVLRDIVSACHENGFKVIARVDFRGVGKEIYDQYPDWFARDVNGDPITLTYTKIPLYVPCYDSYYRSHHGLDFISYLFEEYDIDGIWHNAVHVREICYCEICTSLYLEELNEQIPVSGKSNKAELDRYYIWKSDRASNHMNNYRTRIKQYGEDKSYAAEVFGMYDVSLPITSGVDLYSARDYFDFLVSVNFLTENQREVNYKNLGYSASIVRFLKALDPRKQPVILFGQNGTSHRYIMEPETDSRIFLWQAIASGGGIWNCSFTGQHPDATLDRRNAHLLTDFNLFIKEKGYAFMNTVPSADVMIYYSKSTRSHFGNDNPSHDHFGSSIQGFERMCRDNHIQYGFLPDDNLSDETLENVKILIMPNVASLSDKETEIIRRFVEQGGNLIATFKTSLYDQEGSKRKDFSLGDLFGVQFTGETRDTYMDSYQWINDHSMITTNRMKDTRMLINGGETLLCNITTETVKTICSYIPRIMNQPPEMAWIPEAEMMTDHPTLVVNEYGQGKVIYFANQPDRMNYLMGHRDFSDLMHSAVLYLLEDRTLVSTNAPSSVNIWLNESYIDSNKQYVVSLVNLTGGPERPLRSLSPVYDIEVKLRLPGNLKWESQILRKESNLQILQEGEIVTIKLDRIDEFVSVKITGKN
jgi:hypothetical protein